MVQARSLVRQPHPVRAVQKLERRVHAVPDPEIDADLDVPGSEKHNATGRKLAEAFETVARSRRLRVLNDNPVWYFALDTGLQKVFFCDAALARTEDPATIVADDLKLVVEVVSTNDPRREKKDTIHQKALNEANGVPEFALLFPELDDPRTFELYRLGDDGKYVVVPLDAQGRVESWSVPGLSFRVLPPVQWQKVGFKVQVYDADELLVDADTQLARARKLEVEKTLAEREAAGAKQEAADAERKAADAERKAADAEKKAADAERNAALAVAEKQAALDRAAALAAKLRALGIDPEA
ncbi:MAG: Uma2 family endonuclease [Deltaproteobacteria bacterium]|nr:Uma2 family endonuclease [Deltaproteobacteria bacterium]